MDTIFALSSGMPPSGIAVIRISGPGTRFGLETLVGPLPEPRSAALRSIAAGGELIDRGLVLFFPAPASFTGEDVTELQVHGGRAVVAAVLGALGRLPGFRGAEPGEFTRRAFVNGRLDLTQVEGLADLIGAETEAQRRQALRQAEGGLRHLYDAWRERLVRARALIEAELDFPDEEDVPGSVSVEAFADLARLAAEMAGHLADGGVGERLRDGIEVVVLGPPNAGKSSLINALARRDVAIVTPEPGTTRDLIEVHLDLGGVPVVLVDTAGLREAAGAVEAEGIRRATARAESADIVLWLEEASAGSIDGVNGWDGPRIAVGTKLDLLDSGEERSRISAPFDVLVSSRTGEGLDRLIALLGSRAEALTGGGESLVMTRARHRTNVEAALSALSAALVEDGRGLELRAEDLRRAGDALGRVTGRVEVEELLDVIFRDFCIGK